MSNIVANLRFSEGFEGSDVLSTIDQYRICLKGTNKLYSLSFNPSFHAHSTFVNIDIRELFQKIPYVPTCEEEEKEDKHEGLKPFLKSFNTMGLHSVQTCNFSSHRNVYSVLQYSGDLLLLLDRKRQGTYLDHYTKIVEKEKSTIEVPVISLLANHSSINPLTIQSSVNHPSNQHLFTAFFTKSVFVIAHCWAPVDEAECLLAVSHRGGLVAVWRFEVEHKKFSLQCIVNVGVHACTRMKMFLNDDEVSLCMATEDGKVWLSRFERTPFKYLVSSCLWDEDDSINVDHIVHHKQEDRLLLSKSNNILCYNHFSKPQYTLSLIKVDCKYHISGILPTASYYIVTTFDGSVYRLHIKEGNQHTLETFSVAWCPREWHIVSACLSSQHSFLVCALTPSHFFCARKNKQPYSVKYTRLRSLEEVCGGVVQFQGPLFHIYDLLCSVKAEVSMCMLEGLVVELGGQGAWKEVPMTHLKVLRFLYNVILHKNKESDDKKGKKEKNEMIERLILQKHFASLLKQLEACGTALTSREKQSLRLIETFLGLENHKSPQESFKEHCPVCNSAIQEEADRIVLCAEGHSSARCGQTLLLLPDLNQRVCNLCATPAIRISKREESLFRLLQNDCCSLCDGLMT